MYEYDLSVTSGITGMKGFNWFWSTFTPCLYMVFMAVAVIAFVAPGAPLTHSFKS